MSRLTHQAIKYTYYIVQTCHNVDVSEMSFTSCIVMSARKSSERPETNNGYFMVADFDYSIMQM